MSHDQPGTYCREDYRMLLCSTLPGNPVINQSNERHAPAPVGSDAKAACAHFVNDA